MRDRLVSSIAERGIETPKTLERYQHEARAAMFQGGDADSKSACEWFDSTAARKYSSVAQW